MKDLNVRQETIKTLEEKAGKNIQWKKRQSLQQMVLRKLDSDMQKNEPGPLSYTIHKNKLKMDEGPECETKPSKP